LNRAFSAFVPAWIEFLGLRPRLGFECCAFGAKQLRLRSAVDIVTPEFSLALRHSSGQLWPQNENLVFGNDFNPRASQCDPNRAKPPLGRERARRVTFITSGMATLMEEAR
jgi:hypothetical protein